jgi:hypothetical protein
MIIPLLCPARSCLRPVAVVRDACLRGYVVYCPHCLDEGKPQGWGVTRPRAVADWNEQIIDRLAMRDTFDVYVPEGLEVAHV